MAKSQIKVAVFAACMVAMAVIVSAHEGHDHADGPMPMMKHGGPGGDTPNGRDDMGGSSSLAPFSALMVGLVAFVFSVARI
uniref:Uncharacterized protein n=1 Tax=Chenopodium quinoa TaxID=63459 RepID=A0A803MBV5_CHEQI